MPKKKDNLDNILNEFKKIDKKNNKNENKNENKTFSQKTKSEKELLKMAGDMWKKVKDVVKKDESFKELLDSKKIEYFRDDLGYAEFMNEYPVMTRYMICMGQYSKKAFKRFLDKVRMSYANYPPPGQRPKGYMEDQWIRRQSDYVRYLWEAYQKGHFDRKEAQFVWDDTYKTLKGEFNDFRDKYEEIKKETEKEKKNNRASNAKELLERLKTGSQELDENDSLKLYTLLKDKVYKKRFIKCMNQIDTDVKLIKESTSGVGMVKVNDEKNNIENKENKPTIYTIKHVNEDEYRRTPDKFKIKEEDKSNMPILNQIPE